MQELADPSQPRALSHLLGIHSLRFLGLSYGSSWSSQSLQLTPWSPTWTENA